MPQSKDKHRKIYTSTDAGHTTLGPNLPVFYNIHIENRTSKKHDSKKVQEKIIVLIFRFKSLVIIK